MSEDSDKTDNLNNFADKKCAEVQNESYYKRKRFNNYSEHSPRCAIAQVKKEGSGFE